MAGGNREPTAAAAAAQSEEEAGKPEKAPQDLTHWDLIPGVIELWLPMTFAFILMMGNEFVNTLVIGGLGNVNSLAGVGLANMMQNCLGISIMMGMAAGMDTAVSQAVGAGDLEASGRHLQRCRAIVTASLLWVYPVLHFSYEILMSIGQDPAVAVYAAAYNRASLVGLVALSQFLVLRQYLQNRQDVVVATAISLITTLLHPIWCITLVHTCELGNAGAGYANSMTWWLQYLMIAVYTWVKSEELGLSTWTLLGFERSGLHGWGPYLEVALPAVVQSASELWCWELSSLVVGYLSADWLAAHVVAVNAVYTLGVPVYSLSMAGATLVGTAIGEGSPIKAKKLVATVFLMGFGWQCFWSSLLAVCSSAITKMYTPEKDIQDLIQPILMWYAFAALWDGPQAIGGGMLRGLGRTTTAAVVTCIMYWAIDMPMLLIIGPLLNQSLLVMWFGLMSGSLFAASTYIAILYRLDYQACVDDSAAALLMDNKKTA